MGCRGCPVECGVIRQIISHAIILQLVIYAMMKGHYRAKLKDLSR